MGNGYTIGALARAAGIPSSTVRYYERAGLMAPGQRSRSNYRLYGESAVKRLRFIRSAQAAGFTLGDVRALLEVREDSRAPRAEVQALIRARLREVAERLAHLHRVEQVLLESLAACVSSTNSGHCGVIEALSGGEPVRACCEAPQVLTLHTGPEASDLEPSSGSDVEQRKLKRAESRKRGSRR
jgi:DNA-binding transcriptional MerR regulator